MGEQPNELIPWLGDELGLTTLGVLAYGGASAAQSEACKGDIEAGIEQFDSGVELGFEDSSLQFGFSDVSPQVQQMVDAGVDFVATCMDFNGHTTLARELLRQEVVATHWLPQAYDHEFLADFGDLFEGSHVFLASLSRERAPAPAMGAFEAWMAELGHDDEDMNELALAGWISADMFLTGLRIAGPEFTREAVVSGMNSLTDYTAQGLTPPSTGPRARGGRQRLRDVPADRERRVRPRVRRGRPALRACSRRRGPARCPRRPTSQSSTRTSG